MRKFPLFPKLFMLFWHNFWQCSKMSQILSRKSFYSTKLIFRFILLKQPDFHWIQVKSSFYTGRFTFHLFSEKHNFKTQQQLYWCVKMKKHVRAALCGPSFMCVGLSCLHLSVGCCMASLAAAVVTVVGTQAWVLQGTVGAGGGGTAAAVGVTQTLTVLLMDL